MHGLVSVCKRYIVSIGYQPVGVILRRLKKTAWVDLLTKYDLHEISCDENCIPITMRYKPSGSDSNTYVLDILSDVVGLMDSNTSIVATYEYAPWCKALYVTGSDTTISNINSLRYRGYYYDEETGFYYLQTRYYDPAICRFINADSIAVTDSIDLLGSNMFSYCENNPVMGVDPSGEWVHIAIGAFIGAAISVADYLSYNSNNITAEGVLEAAVTGSIIGGLSATGIVGTVFAAGLAGCKTYSQSTGTVSERATRTAITVASTLTFGFVSCGLGKDLVKPLEKLVGGFFVNIFTGLAADIFDRSMQTFVPNSSKPIQNSGSNDFANSSGCTSPRTTNIASHCCL